MIEIHFGPEDVGKIGYDDVGTRFVVVKPGVVEGTDPSDEPNYVVTLPSSRRLAKHPGLALHKSWLELPIEWEDG